MRPKRVDEYREQRRMNVVQLINTCVAVVLLFALAIAIMVMVAGCSSDRATDGSPSLGEPIAFAVSDQSAAAGTGGWNLRPPTSVALGARTRTAPGTLTIDGSGDTESLRELGFGVFACRTGLHPYVSSSTTSNLMHNQRVEFSTKEEVWTYSPLVYWPDGQDGADEYATFFAYGPYSTGDPGAGDNASKCIVDFPLSSEVGDPWLTYQLGGTTDNWQSSQVDLVWAFCKDQQRSKQIAVTVNLGFRHALASAGDRITVACGSALQQRLMDAYSGTPVTLTLNTVAVDYQLTRKARLVLNSSGQPNWQAVESEDPMVHRRLVLSPEKVIATATSATTCDTDDFVARNQGVFYIPLETSGHPQQVELRVWYTISGSGEPETLGGRTVIGLSDFFDASANHNLRVTLTPSGS